MKGLILKDIYQLKNYSRVFLVIVLLCVIAGFSNVDAVFMTFYPCVLMGMLPITLFAYDEKEKFHSLLATLPIKKKTYVTAKYVFGICLNLLAAIAAGVVRAIQMIRADAFVINDFAILMVLAMAIGLIAPSVVLPFIFWLGTEKGRFVNILVMIISLSLINVFINLGSDFNLILSAEQIVIGIIGIAVLVYVISWFISSAIFEKKEY